MERQRATIGGLELKKTILIRTLVPLLRSLNPAILRPSYFLVGVRKEGRLQQ